MKQNENECIKFFRSWRYKQIIHFRLEDFMLIDKKRTDHLVDLVNVAKELK